MRLPMKKCWAFVFLLNLVFCQAVWAFDCPTAMITDTKELLALKADAQAKFNALDKKCLGEYQKRNREYLAEVSKVENKEGQYKDLKKKDRESLLLKMKYEYQASQTKFSEECYGPEGKEYQECVSSVEKQIKYLNDQASLRRDNEAQTTNKSTAGSTPLVLTKKTQELNKELGAAQDACVEEIATTGKEDGEACQKHKEIRAEYMSYYKQNECGKGKAGNDSSTMCTASEEELIKINDNLVAKKVKEYQQNHPVAQTPTTTTTTTTETDEVIPTPAASTPAQQTQNTAAPTTNVQVSGMVTTNTNNATKVNTNTASAGGSSSASGMTSGGLFSDLIAKGLEIFGGMREIVYAVSGFGIVAIAIGAFFGTINWKWLVAIIIGLVIMASAAELINYMVDSEVITDAMITNQLIKGS